MQPRTRLFLGLGVGIVVAVIVIVAVVIPRTRASGPMTITVMTRNLYLGADVNRVVEAVGGLQGEEGLVVLGQATRELREIVDRTDFGIRSRLLAAEIAAARPDVVGLQEVALWRQGPMELVFAGRADAAEVDEDFLETLQSELLRRGLGYDVVQVQETTDVEAPPFPATWTPSRSRTPATSGSPCATSFWSAPTPGSGSATAAAPATTPG